MRRIMLGKKPGKLAWIITMLNPSENKKRLLFIGNYFGTNRAWEEVPNRLSKLGFHCIITSRHIPRVQRLLDMITTIFLQRNSYALAVVDIFSGYSFFWAEVVTKILRSLNKPYILVLRGGGLVEFCTSHVIRTKKVFRKAIEIITPSKYLQEGLVELRPNIKYLPNALDLNLFYFKHRESITANLVWVRALHQIYQPQVAVKALALLKDQFPNIHLSMTGQDKKDGSREIIQNIIHDDSLKTNVTWIGQIPRISVPEILQKADIFLNTTLYEGFGTSVLEAAACGLCIVTTNVGELPYLWEEGVDALLVPPRNPEAMAAAVTRILTEPGLAARLSANARKKAERYDWSVILPQWEALFEKVLSDG